MSDEPKVLAPVAELDVHTVRRLGSELSEAAGDLSRPVVLDLSEVSFVDSSALGVILRAHERITNSGRPMPVVVPDDSVVREVIEMTGLERKLQLVPTRADALARVTGEPA